MEERIEDYQERLHLAPTDTTKYTKLTNEELRRETLAVVAELRTLNKPYHSAYRALRDSDEIDPSKMADLLNAFGPLRARSIALHNEILRRIPQQQDAPLMEGIPRDMLARQTLELGGLGGPNPIGDVADYMERLALLLP